MTDLTRRFAFSAAHRLRSEALSEEENVRVFGKCANPFGHGHDYCMEVTVSGNPDAHSGMLLPRGAFDDWVRESVIERIDHRHLNADVREFAKLVPTTENLTLVVEKWLREGWPRRFPGRECPLSGVRIEETPRNSFRLAGRRR